MNTSDIKLNTRFEILTPSGYQDFSGIRKLKKTRYYIISLNTGKTIKCSDNHPFIFNSIELRSCDIKIGSKITGDDGVDAEVVSIKKVNGFIDLYDVINVENGNIFNVDGIVSHNCDFATSGNTVIEVPVLDFYKQSKVRNPVETRGIDKSLWIWEYPDYTRSYLVCADVARGDGGDFSAFHVLDIDTMTQVAEYKGLISTKDYGNLLVNISTEYNTALLVVENMNVGWGAIQQVIDRKYPNLFYSSSDLKYVDVENQMTNRINSQEKKMTPGFTTTSLTRQLIISRLESYMREKEVNIQSVRTIDEFYTFIWNNGRPEAMKNYNDDLVMSLGIGFWVRDTALKLRSQATELTKSMLSHINVSKSDGGPVYTTKTDMGKHSWEMPTGVAGTMNQKESLTWLL